MGMDATEIGIKLQKMIQTRTSGISAMKMIDRYAPKII